MKVPPSPAAALPLVTFVDSISFHVNGDDVDAFHVPPAHTDGDAIVYFRKANVLHMGDTFFNGIYPFVDLSTGGSIAGMIAACDRGLSMGDASTKVIPGHGPSGQQGRPEGVPGHARRLARRGRAAREGGQDARRREGREAHGRARREVGQRFPEARRVGVDPLRGSVRGASRERSARLARSGLVAPGDLLLRAFGEARVDVFLELDLPVEDARLDHEVAHEVEVRSSAARAACT